MTAGGNIRGKWWRLKYRFGGKEKRLSLGVYPDVSLKDARDRCDEARKLLANEIDPSKNRKAKKAAKVERASNSFEVVAREWFNKYKPNWSANHANRTIRRLEHDIFPWTWHALARRGAVAVFFASGVTGGLLLFRVRNHPNFHLIIIKSEGSPRIFKQYHRSYS